MSNDDLIARAKDGDPDAWRELYRAHAGRLVVWLRSRPSGDAALSPEDLAADVWLTAASRIHDFSGTSTVQFSGWLFGIARNIVGNTTRRSARRRTEPTTDDATLELPTGPDDTLEASDWTRSMLASLPPREYDVVACIDGLGLDVASTSEALGISTVAVRVARHRGLARLRRQWAAEPDEDAAGADKSSRR